MNDSSSLNQVLLGIVDRANRPAGIASRMPQDAPEEPVRVIAPPAAPEAARPPAPAPRAPSPLVRFIRFFFAP